MKTIQFDKEYKSLCDKLRKKTRRGVFLDVFELEGSFALEGLKEAAKGLETGEKLFALESEAGMEVFWANPQNGETILIGFVPAQKLLFPLYLLQNKFPLFFFAESVSGLGEGEQSPSIIVSLYRGR